MATHDTSLAPDELDRLEDALERWTEEGFEPGPEDSLLAAPLRERLDGYREVLAATREALPLEDVGDDVLAAVLAEARRGEAKPRREARGPGLWERLRRSMLLPGVALAGSAALLLYLVQPSEQLTLDSPSVDETPALREAARLASEPGLAPAAPSPVELAAPEKSAAEPAPAAPIEEDKRAGAAGATASEAPGAAVAKEMDAKADRPKVKSARKDDMPADAGDEVLPGLGDAPPAAADKEELRDTLETADQARHRGDCKSAEDRYLEAMKMDGAMIEQARARAGYAICMQQQGDEAVASKYFEKARLMYPGIDAWIAREGGEKKPSKKAPAPAPKPKKPIAEPFK